jgi:5-methylcytosine-specific restriction endonuclease McrA
MQSLDRHNASKMHEIRSSLVKKYTCECGKYYIHQQSLRNHKMKCEFEGPKITPTFSTPLPEQTALEKMQQEQEKTKEEMQQEINETKDELEKMKEEINETKEKMQQELDKTKDEIKKMKEEIKKIKGEPKSRDIRKQINKETRTEVVIEQENKCGECKEELSLYFQIDHVVGIQFGGTNEKSNLMALCCECHTKKSIAENKCRRQIKEAIQTILRENS